MLYLADFNLSLRCCGTDIIRKLTKWFQMVVHGLTFGQNSANFKCVFLRFQRKGGLVWYGHYPKMHEMFSDGNFWADCWTDVCKKTMLLMREFLTAKTLRK